MITIVCKNPWCKAHFSYDEEIINEEPKQCPKCVSFNTDLSGGVEWKTKTYEGSRYDDGMQEIKIKINKYY